MTWAIAGLCLALLVGASLKPLRVGWGCYRLHARGEHALAQVLHKLDPPVLVLQLADGPDAGSACTAKTSFAHHAALAVGDALPVVYRPEVPGECELEATLRNSMVFMIFFTGVLALAALGIVAAAALVHRSCTRRVVPENHLEPAGKAVTCPGCGEEMEEGVLVPLAGLHWRRPGEPMGMPHALSGMPGTVGRRGRRRLHAFRCAACSVVSFRYGEGAAR